MNDYQRLRNHAGLADLQGWARFELSGSQATDALDAVVGANVRDLFEGRAVNTLIPSPAGGVEAIVWAIALEDGFRILGEPADREVIRAILDESTTGRDAVLQDMRDETFALALIGPEAEKVAWKAFGDDVHSIAFLNVLPLGNPAVTAARIGYFGEYELHLCGEFARKQTVIDALEQAADGRDLMVGEGALAVMMTEMGTLSRARDVPSDVSVFEAGLQWMIDFRKENLRACVELERRKGSVRHKCVLMIVDGEAGGLGAPDRLHRGPRHRSNPVGVSLGNARQIRRVRLPRRGPRDARPDLRGRFRPADRRDRLGPGLPGPVDPRQPGLKGCPWFMQIPIRARGCARWSG